MDNVEWLIAYGQCFIDCLDAESIRRIIPALVWEHKAKHGFVWNFCQLSLWE